MLSQNQRLRKNSEFTAVYNLKRSVANSLFILYTGRKNNIPDKFPRVAFVVSKKIDKRAVVRNLIKRRMREAYKAYLNEIAHNENEKFLTQWQSLIFIARQSSIDAEYKTIYTYIGKSLTKAKKKHSFEVK